MNDRLISQPDGCIRTGFFGYMKPHGVFVRGDLFKLNGVIFARINSTTYAQALAEPIHVVFYDYDHWFDQQSHTSTLITHISKCRLFSYDGVKLSREIIEGMNGNGRNY